MEPTFSHHRLDAWKVATELAQAAHQLAAKIPKGNGNLPDQLRRASISCVLQIVEAAHRESPADKRNRFVVARGEAGEVAGAAELARALQLADEAYTCRVITLGARVTAMLYGLTRV